jgi:hypothetical protein
MIRCPRCQTENDPAAERCANCQAALLPDWGPVRRIVPCALYLALAGAIAWVGHLNSLKYGSSAVPGSEAILIWLPYGLAGALAVVAVIQFVRKAPPEWRFAKRAEKAMQDNPRLAFDDLTRAVSTPRGRANLKLWQKRAALYPQLKLQGDSLAAEAMSLERMLNGFPKRGLQQAGAEVRKLVAQQILSLHNQMVQEQLAGGDRRAAVATNLRALEFAESHIQDIASFQMDTVQLGAGMTLVQRGEIRQQIGQMRQALMMAHLVRATGECTRCKQTVELDNQLHCPVDRSHKVRGIRYHVVEEPAESLPA